MSKFKEGDEVICTGLEKTEYTCGITRKMQVGNFYTVASYNPQDFHRQVRVVRVESGADNIIDYFHEDDLELLNPQTEVDEGEGKFVITQDSVTVTLGNQTETVNLSDKNFDEVRSLVLDGEFSTALALLVPATSIEKWGQGALSISEGTVEYSGMKLTGKLVDRILSLMEGGDDAFKRFAMFLNLTMEQQSFKTRERLMDFAAHDQLDLDEQGRVVAFKNVGDDYMDKHSGKFRNQVGDSPSMRYSDVDDDHEKSCSQGLHVCSPTYLQGFWGTSGKTMRVVVDPRDFVAIPYDYNDSKARVCKYTVVEDVTDNINDYL